MATSAGFAPDNHNNMMDESIPELDAETHRKARVTAAEYALTQDDPRGVLQAILWALWGAPEVAT